MTKKEGFLSKNPWLSVWIAPRDTLRMILTFDARYRFFVLSFIAGLYTLLSLSQSLSLGELFPTYLILISCLVLATFAGMFMILVVSFLFYWIGKLFKGKGSFLEVRCAVSWSYATYAVLLLVWCFCFALYDGVMFISNFPVILCEQGSFVAFKLFQWITVVVFIWTCVIQVNALSVAQKYARWRALIVLILVIVILTGLNYLIIYF